MWRCGEPSGSLGLCPQTPLRGYAGTLSAPQPRGPMATPNREEEPVADPHPCPPPEYTRFPDEPYFFPFHGPNCASNSSGIALAGANDEASCRSTWNNLKLDLSMIAMIVNSFPLLQFSAQEL